MNTQKKWTKVLSVLLALAFLIPGAGVAQADQPEKGPEGRYIVVFKDHVDVNSSVPDMAAGYGLSVSYTYHYALKGMAAYVPTGRLNALQRDPRVAYVEADQPVSLFAQTIPTGVQRIFADDNPKITIDGSDDLRIDVDVAVLDTGIDLDHPELNVVASTDCTNESGGPPWSRTATCESGGDDGHGHGTHVSGSVAAVDNGSGVVGVAPGARLWAVKVLEDNGSGSNATVIAGIDYVTANADQIDVANMSLGGGDSQAICDAISKSWATGVTYAVAAGNDGTDASGSSPANCADVITVSALADFDGEAGGNGSPTCRDDQDDTLADFSNYGSLIEITAPGVCILSTWNDGGYNEISGTSMASPHVAGAAALLASSGSDPDTIRQTLIESGNFDWTDDSGDGIQEPLLDVGDSNVFAPATVSGGGGDGGNESPTASFTYSCTDLSCDFDGSGSSDSDGSISSYDWDFGDGNTESGKTVSHTYASGGTYTVVLTVTDDDGATDTDSQSVSVSDSGSEGGGMYVWNISFKETGPHLKATVAIQVDSDGDGVAEAADDPVSSASVGFTFSLDSDGDGSYDDDSQRYTGTTDSNGIVEFQWKRAPSGDYKAEVTDLTHSSYKWDSSLDANNPDYYTLQ